MQDLKRGSVSRISQYLGGVALPTVALSLAALAFSTSANAQSTSTQPSAPGAEATPADQATSPNQSGSEQRSAAADIIVTGTLIRGVAPPGASVLSVTNKDITATGSKSVAQLLEKIPQLGSFGAFQTPLANSQEVAVNRPNLRALPNSNTGGGTTTLVLVDGHRVVGMGNASTSPDPDVIPPGVIERVEIVPDGGSAIYGSDAVAGVINFVTLKRFDGVKTDGSVGFADNYKRYNADLTVGKDWGSGSIYASYNYYKSGLILGKDRSWVRQYPGSNGLTSLQCSPGNIEDLAGVFAPAGSVAGLPGPKAGSPNQCDESDYATVFPASQRHTFYAGLTQNLTDSLTFEMRGFYTHRNTRLISGFYRDSEIIAPFPIPGVPSISSPYSGFGSPNLYDIVQQVDFQVGDNLAKTHISLDTWGITPTLTADLGHSFELRLLGNYGQSVSNFRSDQLNEDAVQNSIISGLFNPYDTSTASADVISAMQDQQQFGRTRQYFTNFRGVVDGDLFTLPGGAVKVAAGLEYYREEFDTQNGVTVPGYENTGFDGLSLANGAGGETVIIPASGPIRQRNLSRDVKSAFGELIVPIFGHDNARPGFYELSASADGRYDHYSDNGGTFNPKFGLTYKPVSWITVRGAWGKSFNAPSLADNQAAAASTVFVLSGASAAFFAPPAALQAANGGPFPNYGGGLIVAERGNAPGIKPQTARTWTAGFDVQPPVVPGLSFGATYYNINYKNLIGLAPFQTPALLYAQYPSLITFSPTQAMLDAAIAGADIINGSITNPPAAGTYAFIDARKRNLGAFKLDGVDFRMNYQMPTSFGSISLSTNGTYELHRKQSPIVGEAFESVGNANTNRLRVRTTAGVQVGPLLGQITWNHLSGYRLDPPVGFVPQSRIGDFNTFDLYLQYSLPDTGLTKDMALTLNMDNMFNQAPPVYRGPSSVAGNDGTLNGQTIGRYIQVGISKKF